MAGNRVVADVLKGVAAGAIATWTMNQLTSWLYRRESEDARRQEQRARGGRSTYVAAAERLADTAGMKLERDARQQAGTALHWATGMTAGAAYAVVRSRRRRVAHGAGMPFGTAFFLGGGRVDESAARPSPGPRAFPWQTHARGLGGHLVFGLVAEGALQLLDRVSLPSRAPLAERGLAVLSS